MLRRNASRGRKIRLVCKDFDISLAARKASAAPKSRNFSERGCRSYAKQCFEENAPRDSLWALHAQAFPLSCFFIFLIFFKKKKLHLDYHLLQCHAFTLVSPLPRIGKLQKLRRTSPDQYLNANRINLSADKSSSFVSRERRARCDI